MEDFVEENGFDVYPAADNDLHDLSEKQNESSVDHDEMIWLQMEQLDIKIAKLERKLNSIKLSSADIKAAKRFAKEIFNSGIKLWMEDVSGETDMVRDKVNQLTERLDKTITALDERVGESSDKVDKISALAYMLLVVNGIQLCASAIYFIEKLVTGAVKARRKA